MITDLSNVIYLSAAHVTSLTANNKSPALLEKITKALGGYGLC